MSVETSDAIDRLLACLTSAGIAWEPEPDASADMEELEAAIVPLTLPGSVREWWERLGGGPRRLVVWPEFCPPAFALETWTDMRSEFPDQAPDVLLPVAYSSWNLISVELGGAGGAGGALFQWSLDGDAFHLRYHRLADWLERIADLIEGGAVERNDGPDGAWLRIIDDREEQQFARDDCLPPHPVYGEMTVFSRDPECWPAEWKRGPAFPAEVGSGAIRRSVAEVLASDEREALTATVAGTVIELAARHDTYVRIRDETGVMDVRCPAALTTMGPALGGQFEFDISVPDGLRAPPSGHLRDKSIAASESPGLSEPAVTATATAPVRRVGPG